MAAVHEASVGVEDSPSSDVSVVDESESDDESDIEERIASARRRLRRTDCLFCSQRFDDIDTNLAHMSSAHSFFIPHREELSDLNGLLDYLGEKVAEGNLCLYCPNGGKEFGSLEAARRHMIDKAHCKIPFATDEDRAELADYYWQDDDEDGGDWEDASDQEGEGPARQVSLSFASSRLALRYLEASAVLLTPIRLPSLAMASRSCSLLAGSLGIGH